MNLAGIISIAGKPGLFKVVARSKNGLVVESLVDGKKIPALASHKISALEDISMYTVNEDIKLADVFQRLFDYAKGEESIDPKSSGAELFNYFENVLPEFDRERVYPSDVKKLFVWYNILLKANAFVEEPSTESAIEDAVIVEETENKD